MRPKAFFISEETLKKRGFIDENISGDTVMLAILSTMEEKMHPALGTPLYSRLITGIVENTLTDDEKTLLNDYITPVMSFYVMEEICFSAHIKLKNTGLSRITQENTETLSMAEMFDVMNRYKSKAEFQEQRLIAYLKANATETKFPEYLQNGDCSYLRPKRNAYTCPIVL